MCFFLPAGFDYKNLSSIHINHSSPLTGSKGQIKLETNMTDHGPATEIQVVPNYMVQDGNSFIKFL